MKMKSMKRILITILISALLCGSLLLPVFAWDNMTAASLLNNAPLAPLSTGYTPLDRKVAEIFSSLFSESASTYEKVKLCYDYVNTGAVYQGVNPSYSIYNGINSECNYYASADTYCVARAYSFLTTKRGTCLDFADAFMVLMRAIGLECYIMHGTYDYGPHYWNLMRLNGSYYIFDTEADWACSGRNGTSRTHYSFCLLESADRHRRCNRSACIAEFGSFRCRNKTNNPGVGYQPEPYTTGQYRTNDVMNFRSSPSLTASIHCTIPAGTTLNVTEISEFWGKITYNGKTGWISLDYSTKISDTPGADAAKAVKTDSVLLGDVDGDGEVTSGDARLALRAVVGLEEYAENGREALACDADRNQTINAEDARLILRAAVGMESLNA